MTPMYHLIMEVLFCLLTPMSIYLRLLQIQMRYIFRLKCQILMILIMYGYHCHIAFPSTVFKSHERKNIVNHDYYFFRLPNRCIDTMVDDGSEPSYETIYFSDISNNFEHIPD
jgi:hypothetical protein